MENNLILPDLKDRIQALFIDLIVTFLFAFIMTKIFESMGEVSDHTRLWTFVCVFILYDPILTSLIGGTLGHRALNLRVRRSSNTTKNILFPVAIFRYLIKATLGVFSLLAVSMNSNGRAIHDLLSGSIVILKEKK